MGTLRTIGGSKRWYGPDVGPTQRNIVHRPNASERGRPTKNPIWRVLEDEPSMSDHSMILLSIPGEEVDLNFYRYGITDLERMSSIFAKTSQDGATDVGACRELLQKAYRESTPNVKCTNEWRLPYWRTDEIQSWIAECKKKRKKFQRSRSCDEREQRKEEYKDAKKAVKKTIREAKKQKWRDLCNRLEEEVFGDGYKIVKAQLKMPNPRITLTPKERRDNFELLFITGGVINRARAGPRAVTR